MKLKEHHTFTKAYKDEADLSKETTVELKINHTYKSFSIEVFSDAQKMNSKISNKVIKKLTKKAYKKAREILAVVMVFFVMSLNAQLVEIIPDSISDNSNVVEKGGYKIYMDSVFLPPGHSKYLKAALRAGILKRKYPNTNIYITAPIAKPTGNLKVFVDASKLLQYHQCETTSKEIYAFPNAFGAGANTIGGRGGKVVHVTNLNDSGYGSLRWALTDPVNKGQSRTIVFDVSGVIQLKSNIYMSNAPGDVGGFADGITIAGQTAPMGGITITGGKIRMYSINQVIVRYLKFRETTPTDGCLSVSDGDNVIFDHLSGSHTRDIVFSVTSSRKVTTDKTIQNCLFAQSKNGLIIGDTTPQGDIDYGEISVLRNAYYNVGWRIPFKGGSAIKVDAINNIAHNWSSRLIRMDAWDYQLNHIGNYYQGGYNTTNILKHCSWNNNPNATPKIYNYDNYMDPNETTPNYLNDESVVWTEYQNNFASLPSSWFVDKQMPIRGRVIDVLNRNDLKSLILEEVGACRYINNSAEVVYNRDMYDREFVNGIKIDDNTSRSTSISLPFSVSSNTRPSNFYQTNPHIPEVWFSANVPNGENHNDIAPSGYTWLEEYINQVDN